MFTGLVGVALTDSMGGAAFLPGDIFPRKDIDAYDKIVLWVMLRESHGCGSIQASDGLIARLAGVSRPQVIKSRGKLEAGLLIAKEGEPVKQIYRYRFLHPEMRGSVVAEPEIKTQRRTSSVDPIPVPTPRCEMCRAVRALDDFGNCRACRSQAKVDAAVFAFLADRPDAPLQIVWIEIGSSVGGGRRQIQQAFYKWQKKKLA